jgi:hypothetical protein
MRRWLARSCRILSQLASNPSILGEVVSDGEGVDGFAWGVASADVLPVAEDEDGLVVALVAFAVAVVFVAADSRGFGIAECRQEAGVPPMLAGLAQGGERGRIAAGLAGEVRFMRPSA